MKTSEVFIESLKIRDELKTQSDFPENPIDTLLLPILPFRVSDKIKLIIMGQDPTVKLPESRRKIEFTLNLDKSGSLKIYLNQICKYLEIGYENIYATNVFKYFYSDPPERTMNVLKKHLDPNLELLKTELAQYPKQPIITLGLPVLQLLVDDNAQVRDYWGYGIKTKKREKAFSNCKALTNKLNRDFFPFPHQPSIVKKYYSDNLKDYIEFMKSSIRI